MSEEIKVSTRPGDDQLSAEVSSFLEKELYFNPKYGITNFKRYDDKLTQLDGIDVSFTYNGKEYKCDEKAGVSSRNLKTFVLELSHMDSKKGNLLCEGWFTKDALDNDSYLFVWLDNDENNGRYHQVSKTSPELLRPCSMSFALVDKSKIMEILEKEGWTKDKLRLQAKKMRENNITEEYVGGYKFRFSINNIQEKSINLLFPKWKFMKNADLKEEGISFPGHKTLPTVK